MKRRRSMLPGIVLGFGLGGFVDGIVLHQILQWHHLLTAEGCCPGNSLVGLEDNTLADGIFHAVAWVVTAVGSLLGYRAWNRGGLAPPWRAHVGALLAGWGAFNLIDSANHFVVGLHHVRDDLGGPLGWDVGFLVFALALIGVGLSMMRAPSAGDRPVSSR